MKPRNSSNTKQFAVAHSLRGLPATVGEVRLVQPEASYKDSHYCEETGKAFYSSERVARDSLTGGLKSKRVRVYRCTYHPEHLHITKEETTKL
jgi:hypothetical protein